MVRKRLPVKTKIHTDGCSGSGWLILSVLFLVLTSLRFAYHAALFSAPLGDIRAGALK